MADTLKPGAMALAIRAAATAGHLELPFDSYTARHPVSKRLFASQSVMACLNKGYLAFSSYSGQGRAVRATRAGLAALPRGWAPEAHQIPEGAIND